MSEQIESTDESLVADNAEELQPAEPVEGIGAPTLGAGLEALLMVADEPMPVAVASADEMMIIEEDESDPRPENVKVNPIVRRREYRQLFAQLRNNS